MNSWGGVKPCEGAAVTQPAVAQKLEQGTEVTERVSFNKRRPCRLCIRGIRGNTPPPHPPTHTFFPIQDELVHIAHAERLVDLAAVGLARRLAIASCSAIARDHKPAFPRRLAPSRRVVRRRGRAPSAPLLGGAPAFARGHGRGPAGRHRCDRRRCRRRRRLGNRARGGGAAAGRGQRQASRGRSVADERAQQSSARRCHRCGIQRHWRPRGRLHRRRPRMPVAVAVAVCTWHSCLQCQLSSAYSGRSRAYPEP